jgi:hypothetical protein
METLGRPFYKLGESFAPMGFRDWSYFCKGVLISVVAVFTIVFLFLFLIFLNGTPCRGPPKSEFLIVFVADTPSRRRVPPKVSGKWGMRMRSFFSADFSRRLSPILVVFEPLPAINRDPVDPPMPYRDSPTFLVVPAPVYIMGFSCSSISYAYWWKEPLPLVCGSRDFLSSDSLSFGRCFSYFFVCEASGLAWESLRYAS